MKKTLIMAMCLMFLQCGEPKKEVHVNYTQALSGCLTMNDAKMMEEGVEIFESIMADRNAESEIYLNFANDVNSMNSFTREFFVNNRAKHFLNRMEKTETFGKMFIRWSEYEKEEEKFKPEIDTEEVVYITESIEVDERDVIVTPRLEEVDPIEEDNFDYYKLRTRGPFLQCLIEKSENKDLKEYFETLVSYSDISPAILAGTIPELMEKISSDNDKQLLKLSMVYLFYYEAVLIINRF